MLPSHPSQFWLMRSVADGVAEFAEVLWVLRAKDVIVDLAESFGLEYELLSSAGKGIVGNAREMFFNIFRCAKLARKYDIDLWVTQYGSGNLAALLTGNRSICVNDDDIDNAPIATWATYPFANLILTPEVVRVGRFANKRLSYKSSHELFYLHPSRFTPDEGIRDELGVEPGESYAIIRLVAMHSHHDTGVRGISMKLIHKVIELVGGRMRLFITSEKPLTSELELYRVPIRPDRIHHALAFAEFFLGDSQSMTSEAAVLGTPALRINDFVGRISMIEVWEDLGLAFGFKPEEEDLLLQQLECILAMENRRAIFQKRRELMLSEMVDPVPWFVDKVRQMVEGMSIAEIMQADSDE